MCSILHIGVYRFNYTRAESDVISRDPFVPFASVSTRTLKTIGARRGKTGSELRIPGDGDQRFRAIVIAIP